MAAAGAPVAFPVDFAGDGEADFVVGGVGVGVVAFAGAGDDALGAGGAAGFAGAGDEAFGAGDGDFAGAVLAVGAGDDSFLGDKLALSVLAGAGELSLAAGALAFVPAGSAGFDSDFFSGASAAAASF